MGSLDSDIKNERLLKKPIEHNHMSSSEYLGNSNSKKVFSPLEMKNEPYKSPIVMNKKLGILLY